MTDQETWKLIYVIKASYPSFYKDFKPVDYENLFTAWNMVMDDYSYEQASAGLKVFLTSDTKGFPPSPGQVVDCIVKITKPDTEQLPEAAAWDIVRRAIERGIYHAEEDFNNFPEIIKKCVGSPANIREMATNADFNEGVESSNFYRKYRNCLERDKQDAKIPKAVKALYQKTAGQIAVKEKPVKCGA